MSSQPDLSQASLVHLKIGLLSFGGPAGQIALMNQEMVERRGWLSAEAFNRGLAFSMMLPGPEAQQLATWIGWRLHGTLGGLIAGLAFVLPGTALMIVLAALAATQGDVPLVAALFAGVQPMVIALVVGAVAKISQRALKRPVHWALAFAAFVALYGLGLPFPLVVAAAALIGLALPGEAHVRSNGRAQFSILGRLIQAFAITAALVSLMFALVLWRAGSVPFVGVAELFTSAAFVSFGGAYALLPYVAEHAVEHYGWLSTEEMLNGLAIAEATPGPLILVNTYAGFFAGWSTDETVAAGSLTAALATFYTFAPSFMLILGFAPAVERIQDVPWARRALAGISAAVVGIIANLAFYLGEAAIFSSGLSAPDWPKLMLLIAGLGLVFWAKLGMLTLVVCGFVAGAVLHIIGLL